MSGQVGAALSSYSSVLHREYEENILPLLMKDFGYTNRMMAPKLKKVVVTMGHSEVVRNQKEIERIRDAIERIAGQKCIVTKAKEAISGFKIRQGMVLGCKVTLRRGMMYDFVWKLINVALPRSRNFRGFSCKSFDGNGNFSLGIDDASIFLEMSNMDFDAKYTLGMNVNIETTARSNKEALRLMECLDFPFYDN